MSGVFGHANDGLNEDSSVQNFFCWNSLHLSVDVSFLQFVNVTKHSLFFPNKEIYFWFYFDKS